MDSSPPSTRFFRSSFPTEDAVGFRSAVWKAGVPGADEPVVPLHPTLVAMLDAAARHEGDAGIVLVPEDEDAPDERLSYAQLAVDARRVARVLARRGVRRGDCVLLVFPTSFELVTCFFALLYLGAIPVPSYPPAMMERAEVALDRLAHVGNHARVTRCLAAAQFVPLLGDLARRIETLEDILVGEKMCEAEAPDEPFVFPEIRPRDTAFVQYTSGSTGNPKGVELPHASICANVHAIGQAMQIGRHDVGSSWLPLYHDMGLIGGLFMPMFFHVPIVLMAPTTFLVRPVRWLQAIGRHRATMAVAPNFAYALCVKRVRPSEREGLDLSSVRVALNGAEPVNYRSVVDFDRAFLPYGWNPRAMMPVYGQAECSLAVTFPTPGEPVKMLTVDRAALAEGRVEGATGIGSTAVVGVGRAIPGHRVMVVDAEGNEVPEHAVGHVVARGPSLMKGYFRDAKATEAILRGGWLWTGDLGFVSEGTLFVTGRAKDLIIVRGHNYYAEDVERVAERVEGVRPGGTVGFAVYDDDKAQDLVVLVVETRAPEAEREALVQAVQEAVASFCGLRLDEVVLVPPGTLPKTSSGKRQRSLTRERYLAGTLLSAQTKTKGLRLAMVFARSGAGFFALLGRKLTGARRAPP